MHRVTYYYVLANQWVVHFAVHTPEHPVHVIDKNTNMLHNAPSVENNYYYGPLMRLKKLTILIL